MAGRKPWTKTDHPDVPGESRMEGTRANLGIKIGPDVTVGSVQGSPKRSVNIHCDPNWWAFMLMHQALFG